MNVSAQATNKAAAGERRDRFMAFVADEQAEAAVTEAARRLLLPFASIHRGNVQAAIRKLADTRSPKLLLVDLSDSELPLSDMSALADVCEPGVTVIAMGERNDVGLFRELIAGGVSDYLVKPITPELIQNALGKAVDGTAQQSQATIANKLGRLVAVVGARGGVGATTVAVNAAWHLSNEVKRRVALLDLDLQAGTTALYLDVDPSHGLREAIEDPNRIDSLFIERVATKVNDRLVILSGEEPLDSPVAMDVAGVQGLINELRQQFHYVVVDLPRAFSPATHYVLENASQVVVVTDLTLPAVRETARIMQLTTSNGARTGRIVVANKVGEYRAGLVTKEEFVRQTTQAIDHEIPFEPKAAAEAVLNGTPVVQTNGVMATSLQDLADRLSGRPSAAPSSSNRLTKLLRRR
jgi:pilus assembly protein CpaE